MTIDTLRGLRHSVTQYVLCFSNVAISIEIILNPLKSALINRTIFYRGSSILYRYAAAFDAQIVVITASATPLMPNKMSAAVLQSCVRVLIPLIRRLSLTQSVRVSLKGSFQMAFMTAGFPKVPLTSCVLTEKIVDPRTFVFKS
jgi:hypothetical protein